MCRADARTHEQENATRSTQVMSLDQWLYGSDVEEEDEEVVHGESILCHPSFAGEKRHSVFLAPPPPPPSIRLVPHPPATPPVPSYQQPLRRFSASNVPPTNTTTTTVERDNWENASLNRRRASEVDSKKPSAVLRRPLLGAAVGPDAKMVLERKLQEALDREKHQQLQLNEMKRKMAGLEERVRVVKNEKRRSEKRQSDSLEARVLASVHKVVQDRECDSGLKDKIAEAVALAVAQTLLGASEGTAVVAPPRRVPPTSASAALVAM